MTIDQTLLACIRKADFDYNLIENGDRILVGLSGGKDSMALVHVLNNYRKFKDKNFTFVAVFLDLGFSFPHRKEMEEYALKEGFELIIYDATTVAPILEAHREKGLLPCSICSRMKKACINKAAHELKITKVAFAHHADDAIETLFMNMTYGGRVATFAPKMFLSNEKINFIRPFIYAREEDIVRYAKEHKLPIFKNNCGNDKKTKREDFKNLLKSIYKAYPEAKSNYLTMLTNEEKFDLWFDEVGFSSFSGYVVKKILSKADEINLIKLQKSIFNKVDLNRDLSYILYYKDKPIGFISYLEEGNYVYFSYLGVLKRYRNKGGASFLLHYIEKVLSQRKYPRKFIFTSTRTKKFFLNRGYELKEKRLEKDIAKPIVDRS